MLFALQWDKLCGRLRQRQFAEVVSKGDFIERSGTQETLVLRVAYCGGESRGQLGIASHKPEEFAGIQWNPHLPSKVCNTSSGSGALKSSGTVNWPFAKPMGRGWESGGGFRMVSRPDASSGKVSAPFGEIRPWS